MIQTSQGDIFQAARRVELTIVFGYVGFNQISLRWRDFAEDKPSLRQIRDPFTELRGDAVEWSPEKWLWFVPAQENHGMTDLQLTRALDAAFAWASAKRIKSVATNGIANTDHSGDTAANRRSHEKRAAWLIDFAKAAEQKHAINIELVSLNDIFVRASNSDRLNEP